MASSPSRPGGGLSRAALNKPAASRPAVPLDADAPLRALPRRAPPPAPPSALGEFLQITGGVLLALAGLAALLAVLHLVRDSISIGQHLAESKARRGTLVCQDGRMVRGDGSLRDIVMERAFFVCTDWRTLQGIELEEASKKR
jgi:hypothetical protein